MTMCDMRNPLHCIVPPYMLDRLVECDDKNVRDWAIRNIAESAAARAKRETLAFAPRLLTSAAPQGGKHRLIYDAKNRWQLPGKLVRSEGEPASGDNAVDEAYRFSGDTYDFYKKLFSRNSLDDEGMSLVSCVHYGRDYGNAFWDGERMVYGDGDGRVFRRMTRSRDVVGHELTHGVISFTSQLEYKDEPGALNEHFADVFGVLVRQWKEDKTAGQASWLIGDDIIVQAETRRAIRSMSDPGTAFTNDPYLGDDPQPWHYDDRYKGSADHGGVHINSGIPNYAFFVAATDIGGRTWETLGPVWYQAMIGLPKKAQFIDCARLTYAIAGEEYGAGSRQQVAVWNAWSEVGLEV